MDWVKQMWGGGGLIFLPGEKHFLGYAYFHIIYGWGGGLDFHCCVETLFVVQLISYYLVDGWGVKRVICVG